MATLCLIASLVSAGIDWAAVAQERRVFEYLAKPATLGFLLLYAALGPHVSWFLITALTLSLLGNVYLMLPDELFPAGLGAFLLAHLAYVAGFDATLPGTLHLVRRRRRRVAAAGPADHSRRAGTPLRIGIGVYMAAISLMVASAIGSGSWRPSSERCSSSCPTR